MAELRDPSIWGRSGAGSCPCQQWRGGDCRHLHRHPLVNLIFRSNKTSNQGKVCPVSGHFVSLTKYHIFIFNNRNECTTCRFRRMPSYSTSRRCDCWTTSSRKYRSLHIINCLINNNRLSVLFLYYMNYRIPLKINKQKSCEGKPPVKMILKDHFSIGHIVQVQDDPASDLHWQKICVIAFRQLLLNIL